MKKLLIGAVALGIASSSFAQFADQSLAVLAVGTDGTTLANTGNEAHLLNFTSGGSRLTPNNATGVILSGTATSEGALAIDISGGSRNLWFGGYQNTGTSSIASSSSVGIRIKNFDAATGTFGSNIDIARATLHTGNNFRSAHVVGTDRATAGGSGGTRVELGGVSGAGAQVSTAANTRVTKIFGSNVVWSSASGTTSIFRNTLSGSSVSQVDIIGTKPVTWSPYGFAFTPSGTTLYVASDTSVASGLHRFDLNTGTGNFDLSYSFNLTTTGAANVSGSRHVAMGSDGTLYMTTATTSDASSNHIISLVDSGASSIPTLLATSNTGERFRGIEMVPEPGSMIAIGVGIAALLRRRKK
jgi:hypothetical protein